GISPLTPSSPTRRSSDLLVRLEALARVELEEVVEEALVSGRPPGRAVLRRIPEEAERVERALPGLLARDVAALDADRVSCQSKSDRKSTRLNSSHVKTSY